MLSLIKREIEDNLVLFFIAIIIAIVTVTIVVSDIVFSDTSQPLVPVGIPPIYFRVCLWLLPFLPLASAALGATQMYADRSRKISVFLSTLATTRRQILIAKITAGLIWIFILILPLVFTEIVLLKIYPRIIPVDAGFLIRTFVILFLTCLACYILGLKMGWNQNKFFPVLGSIFLSPVLMSVIVIKGFGIQTIAMLLLFTGAIIVRTWQKFMSTPL